MIKLEYISKWGGTLNLSANELFWLVNVDGLTAAASDISSVVIGGIDGDDINNIQAQPRGIILDLRVKQTANVEQMKRAVTDVVKLKQVGTLKWTQNNRTLTIQGTVEAVTMPRFNNEVTMQISLHCSQPFWEDIHEMVSEISNTIPLQYFTYSPDDMLYFPEEGIPFSVYDMSRTRTFNNTGDVAVGMQIEILAYKYVINPIIYNQNGEFFGVGYGSRSVEMVAGDRIVINTVKGQKSAKMYKNSTNEWLDMLEYIKPQSTWLQLEAGENTFSIDSGDSYTDNMSFTLTYRQRYI